MFLKEIFVARCIHHFNQARVDAILFNQNTFGLKFIVGKTAYK